MIHTQQRTWTEAGKWSKPVGSLPGAAQLVFVFGDRVLVAGAELFQQVTQMYPDAYVLIGSTAGNILDTTISTNSVTISALHFEKTRVWFAETTIDHAFDSKNIGKKLAAFLPTDGLVHSFVLSDGLMVNGSELAASINEHLPPSVTVTGGLAGDGDQFIQTVVGCNAVPQPHKVALIGFYGSALKVGYASEGGWRPTEHTFVVTRSKGNVLYELNGEPALAVYKRLLGERAAELPGSALLFPLQLTLQNEGVVVRTILGVDEAAQSMTFAGDMPEGVTAYLMQATNEELIASAGNAATKAATALAPTPAQFALLVSCVGRRLVLKDQAEAEIQAVRDALGADTVLHGFYSYGELCPADNTDTKCLLHNQTMTITTFAEE